MCEQGNVCDNEDPRARACVTARMSGFGHSGTWEIQG